MVTRKTLRAAGAGILSVVASGCAPSRPSDANISAAVEKAVDSVDSVDGVASTLVEYKTIKGMGARFS